MIISVDSHTLEADMGILRDWNCLGHGTFESWEDNPKCPHGCSTVEVVFLQPPGLFSDRSKNLDKNTRMLAQSYGLTDMSNRGGKAVITPDPKFTNSQQEYTNYMRQRFGDGWGNLPKNSNVSAAIGQYGATPDNALDEAKPMFTPKPVLIRKDHENLRVDVSKAA